jgi:protein-export membrane protein SecD
MNQLSLTARIAVVLVLVLSCLYGLPNIMPQSWLAALPDWMPKQTMTLGLDLQGGAHLVLEVEQDDVLRHAYDNLEDEVRAAARSGGIGYTGLRADQNGVKLALRDSAQQQALQTALGNRVSVQGEGTTGNLTIVLSDTERTELLKRAMAQTLQVLRSRVDEFGVAEPLLQQQGESRVIVELPGAKDSGRAKAAIGRTAQLTFHMVDEAANPMGVIAPNRLKLEEIVTDTDGKVVARNPLVVERRPALTGDMLTSAAPGFDQYGAPAVDIAFDSRGTRIFADISTKNVGKRFAIVLDGRVYSAPAFREPILGGRAQISGSFKSEEAQDLSAILNAGALPAAVKVVEERTIGPTLGADSVEAGQKAMLGGVIGIFLFMILFYGLYGFFADVALVVNLLILLAVMSAMGFTLTLPGMAGIVLTLGMAVDANVLIFERIREELKNGLKPMAALTKGFERAFSIIFDGHVTTLVAAFALFLIGTGPIRGFAVALIIGLAASMFTSITLTRWFCIAWIRKTRPSTLAI